MSEVHGKRVTVWVQFFGDRPYLMLQWHDPVTGKRKSKSAGIEEKSSSGAFKPTVRSISARSAGEFGM